MTMSTIPPDTDVLLEVAFPSGETDWTGPPAWTTSDPDQSTITLVDGSNQAQATLRALAPVTVTVTCDSDPTLPNFSGAMDFTTDAGAIAPTAPIVIALDVSP
ncbi:MAG TPA: hypothetical protein VGJ60_07560 [Chloroflexota bacterium]|jgi:hypothetical protein